MHNTFVDIRCNLRCVFVKTDVVILNGSISEHLSVCSLKKIQ